MRKLKTQRLTNGNNAYTTKVAWFGIVNFLTGYWLSFAFPHSYNLV